MKGLLKDDGPKFPPTEGCCKNDPNGAPGNSAGNCEMKSLIFSLLTGTGGGPNRFKSSFCAKTPVLHPSLVQQCTDPPDPWQYKSMNLDQKLILDDEHSSAYRTKFCNKILPFPFRQVIHESCAAELTKVASSGHLRPSTAAHCQHLIANVVLHKKANSITCVKYVENSFFLFTMIDFSSNVN